ncbi:UDP-glucose 6-dehydrogenase, partial [Gordonibacter pamelaeae]|nr:UDP-glucose 6-dehydrogenase [Gordonibacter pamelaeae]
SVHNNVVAYDIIPEKVDMINNRISPIKDALLEDYLKNKDLHLTATNQKEKAYKDAEFIIVATPTNYDEKKNSFDTSKVENVI